MFRRRDHGFPVEVASGARKSQLSTAGLEVTFDLEFMDMTYMKMIGALSSVYVFACKKHLCTLLRGLLLW